MIVVVAAAAAVAAVQIPVVLALIHLVMQALIQNCQMVVKLKRNEKLRNIE